MPAESPDQPTAPPSRPIRFGLSTPGRTDLGPLLARARWAELAGFSTFSLSDHLDAASPFVTLGAVAGATSRIRLGTLVVNNDLRHPALLAQDAATLDRLSDGRLELGLIKGSTFELYMSNSNPVTSHARYWEAHDLIVAALAKKDGPMSYESDNYNYRNLNVIPGCYQQPVPPIWMTTLSPVTAREAAQRGYVIAITAVARAARACFPVYREEYQRVHGRPAPLDRLCYLGQVVVARDEKTALERAAKLLRFNEASERIDARYINPPGVMPPTDNARLLTSGTTTTHRNKTLPDGTPMSDPPTPREQIINNVLFAGTPDQVYNQIKAFYDSLGGFGHLLVQLGDPMTDDEIRDSLSLYGTEVMPRLKAL